MHQNRFNHPRFRAQTSTRASVSAARNGTRWHLGTAHLTPQGELSFYPATGRPGGDVAATQAAEWLIEHRALILREMSRLTDVNRRSTVAPHTQHPRPE